jgi:hypothetical protein
VEAAQVCQVDNVKAPIIGVFAGVFWALLSNLIMSLKHEIFTIQL